MFIRDSYSGGFAPHGDTFGLDTGQALFRMAFPRADMEKYRPVYRFAGSAGGWHQRYVNDPEHASPRMNRNHPREEFRAISERVNYFVRAFRYLFHASFQAFE